MWKTGFVIKNLQWLICDKTKPNQYIFIINNTLWYCSVRKEGDEDSVLGHERNHHFCFFWERCKKVLPIANS